MGGSRRQAGRRGQGKGRLNENTTRLLGFAPAKNWQKRERLAASCPRDSGDQRLTANDRPAVEIGPTTAPRHFAFHPDGEHTHAINERHSSVTTLDYKADKGTRKPGQTITALPKDFSGNKSTAEAEVHSSGSRSP